MLAELKFVMGAVAKKDFVPALTHFVIEHGTVRGYNGTLAICSPVPLDIACKPKAAELVAAIAGCVDTVQMKLTPTGKLSITSGPFKKLVNCVQEDTPHVRPEGERVEINGEALLAGLKAVWPIIGDDASRPWSAGVLLRNQSMFATCNTMLVEYWVGSAFPHVVNVPRAAVREMIRINEPPLYAQMVEGNNITFHYSGDRWIRTQLLVTDWPDLEKILNVESKQAPLDERLFVGLKTLKPFVDKMGRIYLDKGLIRTHAVHDEADTYVVPDLQDEGLYNYEMLMNLEGIATTIDLSTYPKACIFIGTNLRGAIIGMRQ